MKITFLTKKPKTVSFLGIPIGQTFFDEDGELCIRIHDNGGAWNCVSISKNALYSLGVKNMVTPVNAELVVDGEEA